MNWSLLLPVTWNPIKSFGQLFDADPEVASHALSDTFIFLTIGLAAVFFLWMAVQTVGACRKVQVYLNAIKDKGQAAADSDLPCFRELAHHLIYIPARDGTGGMERRRTVDAAEIFRESRFAPGFASNRFFLALPGILTGLGVLGTFVGLQMGIGNLDLNNIKELETSIVPLIHGCAVAFSTSVWGVLSSLSFSGAEKILEWVALWRISKLQNSVDGLFPRYVPEEALAQMERTSRGSEELLKGLAVAIGDHMQQAIGRLGAEVRDAVSRATAEGHGPLMEKSAELLSTALTRELANLREQIEGMSSQFTERFTGASDHLQRVVQGFQPVVESLFGSVGDARVAVTEAVNRLNAQEPVMREMGDAAKEIRQAAELFASMNATLTQSAARNEEASKAQHSAAQSNERVAEQFERIGQRLPEVERTLEEAARVIGSVGAPLADLQTLLAKQPEIQRRMDSERAKTEENMNRFLLSISDNLAEKVGAAAEQFSRLGNLAEQLNHAANVLSEAGSGLQEFGRQMREASNIQREASAQSRAAAVAGERAAKAFEPLPDTINRLTNGLDRAGASVRAGAESARDQYQNLIKLQEQWFAGAEIGLKAIRDRLQGIIEAYGDQIEGQTRSLMQQWTEAVAECLKSYEAQVSEITGGLDDLHEAIRKLSH